MPPKLTDAELAEGLATFNDATAAGYFRRGIWLQHHGETALRELAELRTPADEAVQASNAESTDDIPSDQLREALANERSCVVFWQRRFEDSERKLDQLIDRWQSLFHRAIEQRDKLAERVKALELTQPPASE
jgi:hypothetical protein